MDKILYHELRRQIKEYIREKGVEQGMIDLYSMIESLLLDLKGEREKKPHEGSATPQL